MDANGNPLPKVYHIKKNDGPKIEYRMLDAVNALRQASGARPVQLNSQLNAAAATHARDMSIQNRPWHFGSDGSSPLDRVRRVGYQDPRPERDQPRLCLVSGEQRQAVVDAGDGRLIAHPEPYRPRLQARMVISVPLRTMA